MYTYYLTLSCSLLALLGSATASPYYRFTPSFAKVTTSPTATVASAGCTKTIVFTKTLVLDRTSTSTFILPPAEASLTCPTPSEVCIINGIAVWPSSKTETARPTSSLDAVASASLSKSPSSSAPIPSPTETHSTTKPACPNKHSSLTTSLLPGLSQTHTGLHMSQLNMKTPAPAPTPAPSKPRNVDTMSFDPVAWAQDTPRPHAKRSPNHAQTRFKPFFFVAAHPQGQGKHQQIVRDEDEDEDENYQRSKQMETLKECVTCEKGWDLVCINGTHYGFCDEGCAEPRKLREGMKCVDGRMFGARGWRERMER